ncbi:cyclopropane-fatty-acyl-phospholipid synthase [bacterium BMS3Bbin01]|nr:cyclopropane-fatty-acyl-phospholipid synthase [bacterium BMS3Bbin01]
MDTALATSRSVYEQLAAMAGEPTVAMRAWNGDVWGPRDAPATVVLNHPGALRALLVPLDDLTAGEAYIYDDIDIEGSILEVLRFATSLRATRRRPLASLRLLRRLRKLPAENRRGEHTRPGKKGRLHSKRRDSASVTAHYDTGNDFFRQFLDPGMVYSCGAFLDQGEPLEMAQRRKIDLICRKLQLRSGQRLLDIGCGWGALAIHAAQHYDVDVMGVTLSRPQVELATAAAADAGVGNRVTFEVLDYRDVKGRFDAIASVGMFEHVGKAELAKYFARVRDMLEPGGTFLNHGIVTRDRQRRRSRVRPSFIDTYVFPDSELVTVDDVIRQAEAAGFELRDAESLRTSYALTLRHWIHNLETNSEAAMDAADETTYRIWRLYMAGSAVGFDTAALSVYQLLFDTTDRPWTFGRSHMLAADE